MNNILEKKLNEYREDLKELNNDSDNKYLQTRFEYEKQCKYEVINRMGGNK